MSLCCSQCNKSPPSDGRLVEVFLKRWNDQQTILPGVPSKLCGSCLIGWSVPVKRLATEEWEFGYVMEYNSESMEHHIQFSNAENEWSRVESNPYVQYVEHCETSLAGTVKERLSDSGYRNRRLSLLSATSGRASPNPNLIFQSVAIPDKIYDRAFFASTNDFDALDDEENDLRIRLTASFGVDSLTEDFLATGSIADVPLAEVGSPVQDNSSAPNSVAGSPSTNPRLWTPDEDKMLMKMVNDQLARKKATTTTVTIRWSEVAKAIPGRTGKQCRERYLNHLKPSLKVADWSAVEDATIFRLYATEGSRWSRMAKLLRGRTDNSIKNRYHHLKRRLVRQMQNVSTSAELDAWTEKAKQLLRHDGSVDPVLLRYALVKKMRIRKNETVPDGLVDHVFGPFVAPPKGDIKLCERCGLSIPSQQTGRLYCKTTGWCVTCSGLSPCLNGNMLRLVHEAHAKY